MANEGNCLLSLIDTATQPAPDPAVRVTFRRPDGTVLLSRTVNLNNPVSFRLPAFPQVQAISGLVEPSRFRTREVAFFMLTHDETIPRQPTVFRQPDQWQASFDPWTSIKASVADLAAVMEQSPDVLVKGWKSFPLLTRAAYDAFGSPGSREELPKATLLNVHLRLSTSSNPTAGRPWFSYVKQVLELGRERIIALVDPAMGKAVEAIRGNIGKYKDYELASADLHFKNFPSRFGVLKKDTFSLKTKHKKGNLQLTLGPGTDEAGKAVLLLDADIDENGRWLAHALDVFKHKFTGGTHPFDVHEGLALENKLWPIGYRLV